jgi:hypothetical protein
MGRGLGRRSIELIDACHEILDEIQPATVRAVCYRLFTLKLIADMSRAETNRVSRTLTTARERGLIPWEWIVDETRSVESLPTWENPKEFADAVTRSYRRNKWAAQPCRVEVWSEKGTVRGTLAPVLNAYEVPFRVMHGYASATAMHDVACESLSSPQQPLLVFYVGDYDPSGLHMSEIDLPARLTEYRALELGDGDHDAPPMILRVALTADDVPGLPSFAAATKRGDPRWRWYVKTYGRRCWELDALSPVVLRERVEAAIVSNLDRAAWDRYVTAETAERESIERSIRSWNRLARLKPEAGA